MRGSTVHSTYACMCEVFVVDFVTCITLLIAIIINNL